MARPTSIYRRYPRSKIDVHTTISREFMDFLDKNRIPITVALARGVRLLMTERLRHIDSKTEIDIKGKKNEKI